MANKKCELCETLMIDVHHSRKYCEDCKKYSLKINQNRHYDKYKEIKKETNEHILFENFHKVVREPFTLTGKGFNTVSDIKCKAYTQFLNKKWIDILKEYKKFEELLNYIGEEYKKFVVETGKVDLRQFAKSNNYLSYDLLRDIGTDLIKKKSNISKLRYTEQDFINNLNQIINAVKAPPLYSEFEKRTKINLNTYAVKYKLKGKVYNKLMKILLNSEQYQVYLERYKIHKSNVGKMTGVLSAQFSDIDYELEFKRVFENCINEYGEMPSRRLFNSLSRFDDSTYRRKYDKSWLDICEMYGYKVERNHKCEKILLNIIKDLTDISYFPQKTWKWLIGVGGKNLYCDGYFDDLKLVIEFDGVQHRQPVEAFGGEKAFKRLQENDKLKENLLNKHDIKLIRIASNTKWYDKEFIRNILVENNIPITTPTT